MAKVKKEKKLLPKLLPKPLPKLSAKPLPKKENKIATRTIDASGRILGRLATEIAIILRGKDKADFRPNVAVGDKVIVLNAAKIKVSGKKETKKLYYRHSGYPGHLKVLSYQDIFQKNPSEVLRRAVLGMLPKNKLRKIWIKNLEIRNEG